MGKEKQGHSVGVVKKESARTTHLEGWPGDGVRRKRSDE